MSENSEGIRTAVVAMSRMPKMVIKFLFTFMRFKRRAKKSAKHFRKAMIRNGMDRKLAKELAEAYEVTFSVRELMKNANIDIPGVSSIFG